MSLRSIALVFVAVGLALSFAMSLYGQERCTGYAEQMAKLSSRVDAMERTSPTVLELTGIGPQDGSVLVGRGSGAARIEYRERGRVIAIGYLGEGSIVVRRDLLVDGRVRARQYFDGGRLVRRQFIDAAGNVACTDVPAGIIPTIPVMRPGIY